MSIQKKWFRNLAAAVCAAAANAAVLAATAPAAPSPSRDPEKGPDAGRVAAIAALLDERPSWRGETAEPPSATEAEEMRAQPIPECRDEDYLLTSTTGDRVTYQKPYFKRMNAMLGLARFAAKTGDARCLRRVADYMDAIAGMRSWKMPAHDKTLSDFRGETVSVDLGASNYAAAIAETLSLVGDRLPPESVARIRAECERRIFAPYRALAAGKAPPTGGHWWFFGSNNWNAVCHANVVIAALALVEGRDDRAGFVEAAERAMPFYLAGFLDDGYCSEGGGYWNYGYGHFLSLVSAVRRATQGRVDFGSLPTAERPMRYGFLYRLVGDLCPNFADGGSAAADRRFLAAGAEIWPDLKPMLTSPLPPRTWFPSGEVYIGRAGGLAFAVKGGNNQEKHNHNDVGSWDLVVDGVPVAGDPQGEVYTARTFSKDRYVSNVLNSHGHPVPAVGGEGQAFGAAFRAEVVSKTFADDRDELVLDIAKAYPNPPQRLVRTATLTRGDAPSVTIRDEVAFAEPKAFETAFVTSGEVEKSADGRALLVTARTKDGKRTARLRVAVETTGGGDWTWASETIENPGRPSPHRYAVRFVRPVKAATVAFVMTPQEAEAELKAKLPQVFAKSAAHYRALDAAATPLMRDAEGKPQIPHGWRKWKTGKDELDMRGIYGWTSGHFPGSLWLLHEATGDAFFRDRAAAWTELLRPVADYDGNHDIGFMMYCSFGTARRVLKTDAYDALLVRTAESLTHRYSDALGLIRSWGKDLNDTANFLVIPDNLMNLELLEFASRASGNPRYAEVARSHATKTMRSHFRVDGGAYHVLDYDQRPGFVGTVQGVRRGQGLSCTTTWSRGQAWAIYGYAMMFRETKDAAYLAFAQKVADYALDHPNMPADGIPCWDFGAPGEERDSSAGAVMASGLLELAGFVGGEKGAAYRAFAVKQLLALASPAYFSEGGEIGHWLLKHGVGNKANHSEVDTPLCYGDYYFLEALLRFRASVAQ